MSSKEDKRKLARTQGRFSNTANSAPNKLGAKKSMPRNLETSDASLRSNLDPGVIDRSQFEKSPKKTTVISKTGFHMLNGGTSGDSWVFYDANFLDEEDAYGYFFHLKNKGTIKWMQKDVVIGGVNYPQPRLVSWYGPMPYSYSGTTLEENRKFPPVVQIIKEIVEEKLLENDIPATFNSVLLNLYRHNKDSVDWHSDDELLMSLCPTIASVSLGEVRKFEIRRSISSMSANSPQYGHQKQQTADYVIHLAHGSLVVMGGDMQKDWQHRVPKEFHDKGPRINLTFRTVNPP